MKPFWLVWRGYIGSVWHRFIAVLTRLMEDGASPMHRGVVKMCIKKAPVGVDLADID